MTKRFVRINEVGKIHGNWKVLSFASSTKLGALWNCECVCGVTRKIHGIYLRSEKWKSCGCSRIKSGTAQRSILAAWKTSSKKRKIPIEISDEIAVHLMGQLCFYCGSEATNHAISEGGEVWVYNGMGRVNNTLGYPLQNCVPCCKNCNRAKLAMSQDEFFSLVKRVYEKHLQFREEKAS